jgi:hypothetical protein
MSTDDTCGPAAGAIAGLCEEAPTEATSLWMSAPRRFPVRRFWHGFACMRIHPAFFVAVGGSRSPNGDHFIRRDPGDGATNG